MEKKKVFNKLRGFTIIEVVLVLAIAGLIFLMVFIALPNLQITQRDTQRRENLNTLYSAITQYATNNNGRMPGGKNANTANPVHMTMERASMIDGTNAWSGWSRMFARYIFQEGDSDFDDPSGESYYLYIYRRDGVWGCSNSGANIVDGGCSMENVATVGNNNNNNFSNIQEKWERFDSQFPLMVAVTNAKCASDEGKFTYVPGRKMFAVAIKLEGSGHYCMDNS